MNKNVTVIPARNRTGGKKKDEEKPKLRVAAYCRVSTDSDEQASSYEAQIEHYTAYINGHPDWGLAGIYADDGISGTNTKKREEFNRMIDECMAGHIEMIITKSISRFARNTLDCLKYIRQLKEKNIPVYFEKENINSIDSKGEVMLTIMASLAQQESQSLSQNVKLGLQYRYQQGEIQVNCKWFLGYTKDENKHLDSPAIAAIHVKASVNNASIPATASHDNTPADERKPIISATRMMTATEMALDTSEVSTCPHSAAERAIGMEWNRSNIPLCISINRR